MLLCYLHQGYCESITVTNEYIRNHANLTEVPLDIPPDTTKISLRINHIPELPDGVFSHLEYCVE